MFTLAKKCRPKIQGQELAMTPCRLAFGCAARLPKPPGPAGTATPPETLRFLDDGSALGHGTATLHPPSRATQRPGRSIEGKSGSAESHRLAEQAGLLKKVEHVLHGQPQCATTSLRICIGLLQAAEETAPEHPSCLNLQALRRFGCSLRPSSWRQKRLKPSVLQECGVCLSVLRCSE